MVLMPTSGPDRRRSGNDCYPRSVAHQASHPLRGIFNTVHVQSEYSEQEPSGKRSLLGGHAGIRPAT